MPKSLIIVLAVCLISVHAFVKREAPAATDNTNYLEDLQRQLGDLSNQISGSINPDQVQKGFNDAVNNLNKLFEDFKTHVGGQKKSDSQ